MKKAASIYFLAIAIPATCLGLYGEYVAFTFLRQPALDPHDPDYSNPARLVWESLILGFLIISGVAFLPGYSRNVFQPTSGTTRLFWRFSAIYNTVLLLAFATFIFPMGRPPAIDLSVILVLGLLFGIPLIGLLLSCLCAAAKKWELEEKSATVIDRRYRLN